jgi:hypothetical protein
MAFLMDVKHCQQIDKSARDTLKDLGVIMQAVR